MANKKASSKTSLTQPERAPKNKLRRRLFVALGVVVVIISLWIAAQLWSTGPGKSQALQEVNRVTNQIRPWQFGKVLYDNSIAPEGDQPPERDFYIVATGNPQSVSNTVTNNIVGAGFTGDGPIAQTQWSGLWQQKTGNITVDDHIIYPGNSFVNPDGSYTHVGPGQTGLIIKIAGN